MDIWDGKIREGHGIAFDGRNFYDIPPPDGGYKCYQVWEDGKVVVLITTSQYQLMIDKSFWQHRYEDQLQYIRELADRKFEWNGRMQQILESALEMLEVIKKEL